MEFQAHEKSMDYFTSQEIPDMVSQILWVPHTRKSLLTCNAKQIKFWSLKKKYNAPSTSYAKHHFKKGNGLQIPKLSKRKQCDSELTVRLNHTYKCSTMNSLHSLSMASDQQNFLSSDEK
jgi:hypothetical protein